MWEIIKAVINWLLGRWKKKQDEQTIADQEQVIETYHAQEDIHTEDQKIDADVQQEVTETEQEVAHAPTKQEAAEVVSGKLNDYFNK